VELASCAKFISDVLDVKLHITSHS